MILTREQILQAQDRVFVTVAFPGLGGELRLGSLTAGPALELNALRERKAKGENVDRQMLLLLIEKAIVNAKDAAVFDHKSAVEFLDERMSLETMALLMSSVPQPKRAEVSQDPSKPSTDAA